MDKQCKAVIKVARRALALLDPDWSVASELRQALEQACRPVEATRKATGKVNVRKTEHAERIAEFETWKASGETVKAFHNGVLAGFREREADKAMVGHYGKWKPIEKKAVDTSVQDAQKAALELCACGHKASEHENDELENLLKCTAHIEAIDQDCACDHFHYEVKQAA